jgi:hypothetical protein
MHVGVISIRWENVLCTRLLQPIMALAFHLVVGGGATRAATGILTSDDKGWPHSPWISHQR